GAAGLAGAGVGAPGRAGAEGRAGVRPPGRAAGAAVSAGLAAPCASRAARSLRTTGGSIVEDGPLTNSPISLSCASATLVSTPSSEAISCTRGLVLATILLSGVHPDRADR